MILLYSIAVVSALALMLKPLLFPRQAKPTRRTPTPEELEDFELPKYNDFRR